MLRVKLVKSVYGNIPRTRATVKALGLGKLGTVVEHEDTPNIRGMIHHVKHLLDVQVVEVTPVKKTSSKKALTTPAAKKAAPKAKDLASPAAEPKPAKAAKEKAPAEVKPKAKAPAKPKKEKES
jgi:large subunit ribosomal protein L30